MFTLEYISLYFILLLKILLNNQVQSLDTVRYRQEALVQHNLYRKECRAEPLRQNSTLDEIAQRWCNELASRNEFNHSGTIEYGENSYKKVPFDFANDNGATPVKTWYKEKPQYSVTNPERALHFTQIVWKSTKFLGIGVCEISNGSGLIFVANYYPRGNYKDQFAQNVDC